MKKVFWKHSSTKDVHIGDIVKNSPHNKYSEIFTKNGEAI
jgi:hypothetical protein